MERRALLGIIANALGTIAWKQPRVLKPYTDYKYGESKIDIKDLEKGFANPNDITIIIGDVIDNGRDQTIIEYKGNTYFLKENDGNLILAPYKRKVTIKELNPQ